MKRGGAGAGFLPEYLLTPLFFGLSPPSPFLCFCHNRRFILIIHGSCQYFPQKEGTKVQTRRNVKHSCLYPWCVISYDRVILMHLLLNSMKSVGGREGVEKEMVSWFLPLALSWDDG